MHNTVGVIRVTELFILIICYVYLTSIKKRVETSGWAANPLRVTRKGRG